MNKFERDRDVIRFLIKQNLDKAKEAEKKQELQRVEHGLVPAPRWRLIDKVYDLTLDPRFNRR